MLIIDRTMFLDFVVGTQYVVADVSTLAPAWFIVATNKQLRKEIIDLFTFKSGVIAVSSMIPVHVP